MKSVQGTVFVTLKTTRLIISDKNAIKKIEWYTLTDHMRCYWYQQTF